MLSLVVLSLTPRAYLNSRGSGQLLVGAVADGGVNGYFAGMNFSEMEIVSGTDESGAPIRTETVLVNLDYVDRVTEGNSKGTSTMCFIDGTSLEVAYPLRELIDSLPLTQENGNTDYDALTDIVSGLADVCTCLGLVARVIEENTR